VSFYRAEGEFTGKEERFEGKVRSNVASSCWVCPLEAHSLQLILKITGAATNDPNSTLQCLMQMSP